MVATKVARMANFEKFGHFFNYAGHEKTQLANLPNLAIFDHFFGLSV